jgi:uncharacterized membrane protein
MALLAVVVAPPASTAGDPGSRERVSFATVQGIIEARCQTCHSEHPTREGFTEAPLGVMFDTPEQIQAQATRIEQMAVITQAMPLGNVTGMTQQERDTLRAWIDQGATGD